MKLINKDFSLSSHQEFTIENTKLRLKVIGSKSNGRIENTIDTVLNLTSDKKTAVFRSYFKKIKTRVIR